MVNLFAVQTTRFGVGQRQLLHRAGHADVGQAAFLFETSAFVQRHLAGEHAFFHADDKHLRELQTFRRVQGHQLNRILPGIRLPFARLQRGVRQERLQRH